MLTCPRYIGRWVIASPPSFSVVIASEKLQAAVHYLFLRVDRRERAGSRQRVTGKKPLVQYLAAAERRAGNVPGQPEQFDPVLRRRVVGCQILLDRRAERALHIGLGRGQHK